MRWSLFMKQNRRFFWFSEFLVLKKKSKNDVIFSSTCLLPAVSREWILIFLKLQLCKVHIFEKSVCTVVKSKVKILQNFVSFSEYMNFKIWNYLMKIKHFSLTLHWFHMCLEAKTKSRLKIQSLQTYIESDGFHVNATKILIMTIDWWLMKFRHFLVF